MGVGGVAVAYIGAMPDTPLPNPLTDEEIETRLLAAAVREAEEEDVWIPHDIIKAEMRKRIEELQARIDALTRE